MKRVVFLYKDVKMGCIVDQMPLSAILLKQGIDINDIEIIEVEHLNSLDTYSYLNNLKNTKDYDTWNFDKKYKLNRRLEDFFDNYKEEY